MPKDPKGGEEEGGGRMILKANAMHIPLRDETVQMCVTSPHLSASVQPFAFLIEIFAFGNIPIREREIVHYANRSILVAKFPRPSDFCPVLHGIGLQFAESKNGQCLFFLHPEIWKHLSKNRRRRFIRCLITEQWSACFCGIAFTVIPSTKRLREKADGGFIDHADLYPCMVSRSLPTLAFIGGGFLDSDITFPIHKPRKISQRRFHSTLLYTGCGYYTTKGGDGKSANQGGCTAYSLGGRLRSMLRNQSALLNWGLRDYGTAKWEGGDEGCDHIESRQPQALAELADRFAPRSSPRNPNRQDDDSINTRVYRSICKKCGATRKDSQLGLEKTPEEYVANMVAVFREVRRVLKKDGVLWLNLGDSYANNVTITSKFYDHSPKQSTNRGNVSYRECRVPVGLKTKDLVGIPWRVAFALQADGWYLRSDIIWAKPNPMPESVTDRPTKSHEYIYLLSKSARYYYNAGAIFKDFADERMGNPGGGDWKYADGVARGRIDSGIKNLLWNEDGKIKGRNRRTVWVIPTQPYSGAHFATFPEEIPRLCILAGSRPGDYILDPFGGSGTTAKIALENGRKPIHLDIAYHELARTRASTTPAMAALLL